MFEWVWPALKIIICIAAYVFCILLFIEQTKVVLSYSKESRKKLSSWLNPFWALLMIAVLTYLIIS